MISQEEIQTGKKVFKRGSALRHGLIDVRGVLDVIKEQQASIAGVDGPIEKKAKSSDR